MKKIYLLTAFIIITGSVTAQNVGIGTTAPASKLHVKGSVDTTQLTIDANSTQSNIHPLIKLRSSSGSDLMWIHTDEPSNIFIGRNAGRINNAFGGGLKNTFIGSNAGFSNTTGNFNAATGSDALHSNTTGSYNAAMGSYALNSNTTGLRNSALGGFAIYLNATGADNSAVGYSALYANTTGGANSAMGSYALNSNTTGNWNSAVGYQSLFYNNTGDLNTEWVMHLFIQTVREVLIRE